MVRVGVIGTGLMGEVHARNVAASHRATLVAIADVDRVQLARLSSQLGCRAESSALDVVGADDVDAVIIASPDQTHAELTLATIAAGKPVLCEKPLARTIEDALAVVRAEAAFGRPLVTVGFMRPFDPAHVAVHRAVADGSIGSPVMFRGTHINVSSRPPADARQLIVQSMIHDIHSARWLMGREIVEVYAQAMPLRTDPSMVQVVTAACRFSDGSLALLDVNAFSQYGYEVSAEVTGEYGVASTLLPSDVTVRTPSGDRREVRNDWRTRFVDAYRIELDAWLAAVDTGANRVGATAWDGYAANVVAEAACRSVGSNRPEPVILAAEEPS